MLREFAARQVPGDYGRRWFLDEYFDLFIWFDDTYTLYGFQLCYDKEGYERALTWRRDKGFSHDTVDTGEMVVARGRWADNKNMSPILVRTGNFLPERLKSLFDDRSLELPEDLRQFISDKISDSVGSIETLSPLPSSSNHEDTSILLFQNLSPEAPKP